MGDLRITMWNPGVSAVVAKTVGRGAAVFVLYSVEVFPSSFTVLGVLPNAGKFNYVLNDP